MNIIKFAHAENMLQRIYQSGLIETYLWEGHTANNGCLMSERVQYKLTSFSLFIQHFYLVQHLLMICMEIVDDRQAFWSPTEAGSMKKG